MTRGDSARGRSAEVDGHQTNATAVGCSPKQASWADDSSVLKIPTVIPQRRQSLRLKEVNAIYKAEDTLSSSLQQISVENIPSTSIHMEVESISPPDDPTINVSLKDLRKRCKSKKRKARTVASSISGLHPPLVKPKEEEPDLDEPLICLKLKRPNKSSTGRKRRKQSQVSDSIIPVEETFAQMTYISFSGGEDSSPVATERLSVFEKGAARDGSNTISESTDESLEVFTDKDPLHRCGPTLSDTVKKEVVETFDAVSSCSVFIGNSNVFMGSSATLDQRVSEEKSADGESRSSTSKILHPCITGLTEMTSSYSSPSVSQMGAGPLLNIPKSVDEVKTKVAGIDSPGSKSETYVYDSSELDFIENYNDHGNSFSELQKTDRGETEHADVTSFTTKPMDCCVNEASFECMEINGYDHIPKSDEGFLDYCVSEVSNDFMETDNYSRLTESSKEYHGEKLRLESSESFFCKLLPSFSKSEASAFSARSSQLVSETADLSLDVSDRATSTSEKLIHDNMMSQIENLAATDGQAHASEHKDMEYIMREEFQNREDDTPVPDTSLCIHERNLTAEHSLLSGDIHDLHDASSFSEEVGSLDSLVRKAICGDARRNNTKDHVISQIDGSLSLKTCDLCDPLHSSESSGFSGDSHAANTSSNGIENLHCSTINEMLPRCAEKLANIGDAEELSGSPFERSSSVENCDSIRKHPDTSFSSACDLHAAKESALRTESLHCSTQDQMLNRFSEDVATSEIEAEELGEVLYLHSPPVLPPDSVVANSSPNVHVSLSKASKEIQSSAEAAVGFPEENNASSEMANSDQEEQSKRENELKCNQGMTVEHPPRKLLSNRKDLSPNSQEKLRRALNRNELDDMGKISNHGEMERMLKSEWVTKRSKSSRNGSPPLLSKGILKQQESLDRNCSCSKNPLIHKQAQRAIIFSQRQMQDIETIATKLLKGLTSMKNIVEDSMGSEACSSASSNFTPEEIRMAIQDASSLEATTQRWLSMMAKDCSRFCKIMKSTENKRAASLGDGKQSKKITFADEAGGSLCQVKVFEQLPASSIVPR